MHVITQQWLITSPERLWSLLVRELPVVADQEQLTLIPVLLRLPGAELQAVVCDPSPLMLAPPAKPIDMIVKFMYFDLMFTRSMLEALYVNYCGDVSSITAEINAVFAAASRN